jgi:hypothetical protein
MEFVRTGLLAVVRTPWPEHARRCLAGLPGGAFPSGHAVLKYVSESAGRTSTKALCAAETPCPYHQDSAIHDVSGGGKDR